MKKITEYICIFIGSLLYAAGTHFFIFPVSLLLGGTSGIAVILNSFVEASSGTILMIINFSLLVLAFFVLGSGMAVKTFVGSTATTLLIGVFDVVFPLQGAAVSNAFVSGIIGAAIIAVASGILFYVDSSSGGTDILALIVKKYSGINIGRALLVTDILIVIAGGVLSGAFIAVSSFAGLLVKTFGIDFVIKLIKSKKK